MINIIDKPFAYLLPLSLEECVQIIEDNFPKRGLWDSPHIVLDEISLEEDAITFRLLQCKGRGLYTELHAVVRTGDSGGVVFQGYARIPLASMIWMCCSAMMLVFFALVFRAIPFLALCLLLFSGLALEFIRLSYKSRKQLIAATRDVFGANI